MGLSADTAGSIVGAVVGITETIVKGENDRCVQQQQIAASTSAQQTQMLMAMCPQMQQGNQITGSK